MQRQISLQNGLQKRKRNTETDTDKSKYIHSSHFHAEYPRGLVKRMILSTFAVENRENGRRLGN